MINHLKMVEFVSVLFQTDKQISLTEVAFDMQPPDLLSSERGPRLGTGPPLKQRTWTSSST